jgi:ABC-type uncharacterized transport system permease subunit
MTVIVTPADGFPSELAVIDVVPATTPVTTPVDELIVATLGALLVHVMARPVSVFPRASRVFALSCSVSVTRIVVFDGASIVTVATGACVTVTCAVALWLPLSVVSVAVTVALPGLTPVTTPLATDATFGAELVHVVVDVLQLATV